MEIKSLKSKLIYQEIYMYKPIVQMPLDIGISSIYDRLKEKEKS
jgi:hypothetical protein